MKRTFAPRSPLLVIVAIIAAAGCATRGGKDYQWKPLAPSQVDHHELTDVERQSSADLLRAARNALDAANAAQEDGDMEAADRYYKKVFQLLIQANPDPSVLYNQRQELSRILEGTSRQMYLRHWGEWGDEDFAGLGVFGDLPMPCPLPEAVEEQIRAIQKTYPKGFQAGLNRSSKYAPTIRRKLAEAGLPQDLIWLAMVESQFMYYAKSRAGAVGMWQFMSKTGERYGLEINSYVDERRNWERATDAAIAYLKDLHNMFGEWPLAVTAYNMGEYGVERTVAEAGGEKDLWRLLDSAAGKRRMKQETRDFYPKLLASILVASDPARYGFTFNPEPPERYERVPVEGRYSLSKLDQACGYPKGTLAGLNPDLVRETTPSKGTFMMAIPEGTNERLVAVLKEAPVETAPTNFASTTDEVPSTYVVRRGDTVAGIASRFGVSSKELMRINNIRSARRLLAGTRLKIPGGTTATPSVPAQQTAQAQQTDPGQQTVQAQQTVPGQQKTYRVKSGDSPYTIAKRHGVSLDDLLAWNNLTKQSKIRVNQTLYVSARVSTPEPSKETVRRVHVVKSGECPGSIAEHYGVRLRDLLAWNKLTEKSPIHVDDELVIYVPGEKEATTNTPTEKALAQSESTPAPAPSSAASPPASPARMHTAKRGDTAGEIAEQYGIRLIDFLAWNNLTKKSFVKVGMKYRVSPPEGASAASTVQVASSQSPDRETEPQNLPVTSSEPAAEGKLFRVAKGQNPWTIAQTHGVSVADLLAWNAWSKDEVLHVGQQYKVHAGPTAPAPAEEKTSVTIHKVRPGQNPTTIARQYGVRLSDLLTWNNWDKNHVLHVGDEVTILK